jgi:spore germination protein KC
MRIRSRRLIVILFILPSLLYAGCWDMREINEMGLVMAVGIDFKEASNRYTVTIQITNPSTGGTKGEASSSVPTPWNCSADGASIFEAVRNIARISSKRITWAHNSVIILGESLAKHDITSAIDFFTTNPELRMKTMVVVSKGDAKDYIASSAGIDPLTGLALEEMYRYAPLPGVSVQSNMLGLFKAFTSDYAQILISAIAFKKSVLAEDQSNNLIQSNTIALEGAAVFKKAKMIGWLTPDETRGIAWVLNKANGTVVTVTDADNGNKVTSIETKYVKTKITSEIINGIPNFTIKITGKGNIVEENKPSSLSIIEFQERIEELLNKKISEEMRKGIDKVVQSYGSDVLGFAQIVQVQNNKEWEEGLKDKWPETFPDIYIKTDVNIDVISSTLNAAPLKETKGK